MNGDNANLCEAAPTLIFACSGAADVGAIADLAARKLTADKAGKMFCLAGVGGRVGGILKTTKEAENILAIDGCPLDCTKLCLEEAGFNEFVHMVVTDFGLKKGEAPPNDENISAVVEEAKRRL
jgi:uncharacterized metal-binding protein